MNVKKYCCLLCCGVNAHYFTQDLKRSYFKCDDCDLVFVPEEFHLSSVDEKAQYDLHCNIDEPGYRRFLQRVYDPLIKCLDMASSGLEFGCGPGPVLAGMLREQGHKVTLYDQFYFADEGVLQQQYDFITATEVFEHLQQPQKVIQQLWSCLRKHGTLAVMTKLVRDQVSFATWHYKTDPTHIIFFSIKTFIWLADYLKADIEFIGNDVIFLRKS